MIKPKFHCLAGAILVITVMTGCNSRQSGFSALLEDAERLMESRPVSVLILIDFLFYPEERLSRCDFEIWMPGIGYCKLGFDYVVKHNGKENPCLFTGNLNNQCDYYRWRRSQYIITPKS